MMPAVRHPSPRLLVCLMLSAVLPALSQIHRAPEPLLPPGSLDNATGAQPAGTVSLPTALPWRAQALPDSARIVLELDRSEATADGQDEVTLTLRLFDAAGQPLLQTTEVQLSTSLGRLRLPQVMPAAMPGQAAPVVPSSPAMPVAQSVRVTVQGGVARIALLASHEPGVARLQAQSGNIVVRGELALRAEHRPLLAVGVIEGTLGLSRLRPEQITQARTDDGFELELRRLTPGSDPGDSPSLGARTAFFLKGMVRGDTLLTLAYDSEKETRGRLFRDIQPDQYYPIYGDTSLRGFDAQSSDRLYVRVDRGDSFVLYGDFSTAPVSPAVELGRYSRSLTGLQHRWAGEQGQLQAWLVRDNVSRVVDEQPARGISGPYRLSSSDGLSGSEVVEIITRDRNQPGIILRRERQVRFVDYEFEPFAANLVFKAPVPSVDANLNPVSVRVTYEVERGGPKYWLGGVDGQWRVSPVLEVGASWVEARDPSDPYRLASANATLRLGERSWVLVEVAQSRREALLERGRGEGARVEWRHEGEALQARAWAGSTDREFSNVASSYDGGRSEAGATASWTLQPGWTVRLDALRSEDRSVQAVRESAYAGVQWQATPVWALGLGVRHVTDEGGVPNAASASGINIPQQPGYQAFQINAPLFSALPGQVRSFDALVASAQGQLSPELRVLGEIEQDLARRSGQRFTVGADYRLSETWRAYGRAEVARGLGGRNGLATPGRETALVAGLSAEVLTDTELFNEYRLRDAQSGRDAANAIGLRRTFRVADGVRFSASAEHQKAIAGSASSASALTGGVELTYSPDWRGTGRLEWRRDRQYDSWFSTVGVTARLDADWALLVRNSLSVNAARSLASHDRWQDRFQIGAAYRDTVHNRVNALGLYEWRGERDDTPGVQLRRRAHVVSVHADRQTARDWWVTGRVAAKSVHERFAGGLSDRYLAYLLGGRITWDLTERWDAGLQAYRLWSPRGAARQDAYGVEVGYLLKPNLWLSAGVNLRGFSDRELQGSSYTRKGLYVRLRFKFDESLWRSDDPRQP